MTTLHEAAQKALGALEVAAEMLDETSLAAKARDELRSALTQQGEQPANDAVSIPRGLLESAIKALEIAGQHMDTFYNDPRGDTAGRIIDELEVVAGAARYGHVLLRQDE